MTVNIFGREYPIKYTIAAENAIAERAGGLENLNAAMEREGAAGRMDIMASMLAALIAGGVARAKLDARLAGDEYTGPEAVPIEDIHALTVAELTDLSGAIMAAIKEGSAVTVELQPQKKRTPRPSK